MRSPRDRHPRRTATKYLAPSRNGLDASSLSYVAQIRQDLERLGRPARKRLGQHFLVRPDIARRIADFAEIGGGETVVEIGPGLGALTSHLVDRSEDLWLVELDADFAALLRHRYEANANVRIVEADACEIDWQSFAGTERSLVVVGNLPYNIATPLLMRLLEAGRRVQRIVVMVQREVAERLRAQPGDPAYSALSALTQASAIVEKGFRVAPSAFFPPPRVDSEVIRLRPRVAEEVRVCGFAPFASVVRVAFTQRRKQLRNSLSALVAEPEIWLRSAGIDPSRRPETLSVAEFAALATSLPRFARHA
jgi:16S rRNA (adenine1518-N6/adenine1519-N6)-dimethyltransferase